MKKSMFFTFAMMFMLIVGVCKTVNAQPPQPPSPEEMAKSETDWMKTSLKLTGVQLPKIEAINVKYAKKMGEIFQKGPEGDFSVMEKKMNEMEGQKRSEFQTILTPEQLKIYDKVVAERRANRPGPPR
jgi:protein CpxP